MYSRTWPGRCEGRRRTMTELEVAEMLAVMKLNWSRFFAHQDPEEGRAAVRLWHGALEAEDPRVVLAALRDCVKTSAYPPVVADICARVQAMKAADAPGASEAFAALKRAVRRGLYHAQEEYERLPPECKTFLGGPSGLRDLAMVDEDTLETVTRGQFIRQYDAIAEKERVRAAIPEDLRPLLRGVIEQLPRLPGGEDAGEGDGGNGPRLPKREALWYNDRKREGETFDESNSDRF